MRLIIKNSDFSSVSIGKVLKDISFSVDSSNYKDYFLNPPYNTNLPQYSYDGNCDGVTQYSASSGDSSYTLYENDKNKFQTDFISVTEGMTIELKYLHGGNNCPVLVCFNSAKQPLVPANGTNAVWFAEIMSGTFVIPSGCSYIKIQTSIIRSDSAIVGTMPTE